MSKGWRIVFMRLCSFCSADSIAHLTKTLPFFFIHSKISKKLSKWFNQPFQKCTLQSFTGSLQGRITTQGDPCNHYREWVCRVQHSSVLITFLPCFNNIEIIALVPVMCTGNWQVILQGLKGRFDTLLSYCLYFAF